MDELTLAKKIKKGDSKAFETLLDTYTKTVSALVYQILQGVATKEDMEECVADVFVEAWHKIKTFNARKGSLKTWLLMLAKYKALSYRRNSEKNREVCSIHDQLPSSETVEEQLLNRQKQELVINTIEGFKPIDRDLFMGRYFQGEDIEDLAEKHQLSRAAVDNRLTRGRKKLREVLNHG